MPKFNLYVPNETIKKRWERYARKDRRSLSDFIRIAVEKEIARMDHEKDVREGK